MTIYKIYPKNFIFFYEKINIIKSRKKKYTLIYKNYKKIKQKFINNKIYFIILNQQILN